ncbi:MAG: heparinase II/III family protein [Pseudomonadota bacterium]
MNNLEDKGLLWRLAGSKTAARVSRELGGAKAQAALLKRTGYAGQPQGLAARLAAEVERGLPLLLGPEQRRAFARFFDGPLVMEQARREAGQRLASPPGGPLPASQVQQNPEEEAAGWPWSSGQRFLRLARAQFLVPDDDLASAALESLGDFMAANPPLMGPGWRDARTMAVRVANWLWGLRFMGEGLIRDPALTAKLVLHLELMAQALGQELELGRDAPGAGLVGPSAALLLLSTCLPFLEDVAAWRGLAAASLGPALRAAFEDGPLEEAGLVAEACEWAGLGQWAGPGLGVELPGVVSSLGKLGGLCRALAPPWGAGAYWGPGRAGAVLGFDPAPQSWFSAPANLAAVLLTAPELRAQRQMDERLFWLYGPEAGQKLRLLAGGAAPAVLESPGAGLGVLAAEMAGHRVGAVLCLASGADPAAALSLCLSQDGQALLLPPGPAGSGPLSPHLRGRAAHNALRVDEAEPQGGAVLLESLESGPRHRFLAASFDGYAHLSDPVTLRRRVYLDLGQGLISLVDQVQAQGRHLCEIFFRLPVGSRVQVLADGSLLLEGDFGRAYLRPEAKAHVSLLLGRSNPTLGWVATRLGQVVPTPVVRIQALTEGNARLTTVLALAPAA